MSGTAGPRLLPAASRVAQPWKNGGGTTATLAQWPEHAALDAIGWRLSIAEVAVAGPFSTFAGIERHLAMLEGAMVLRFAGHAVQLDPTSQALRFAGDAPVIGEPLDGPARDLNLMVDPARFAASLERVDGPVVIKARPARQHLLVLTAQRPARDGLPAVARQDALWFGPAAGDWRIEAHGWLSTITAR